MNTPIVPQGGTSVNDLDFEPDDEQDWQDDMFRERQHDDAIEAQRRQDAQISRAAADYLRGE